MTASQYPYWTLMTKMGHLPVSPTAPAASSPPKQVSCLRCIGRFCENVREPEIRGFDGKIRNITILRKMNRAI